jgi:splicing factor U2AF subunit
MSDTGGFAFIELRTPEECDTALNLNGIPLLGATLKIGRPKGYQQALATGQIPMPGAMGAGMGLGAMGFGGGMLGAQQSMLGAQQGMLGLGGAAPMGFGAAGMGLGQPVQAGVAPAAVPALPAAAPPAPAPAADSRPTDVILVGNLAPFMTEGAVKEIMEPFGPIAAVTMLPPAAGSVAGGALVTYANPALVDTVIAGLHDLPVGDFNLQLTRAPASLVARVSGREAAAASPARVAAAAPSASASAILELHNIVVARDLGSSEEVSEIREDVAEECSKFGRVVEVLIPPLTAAQSAAGQEAASVPVYVLTGSEADAAAVAAGLRGRRFEGRAVGVQFVSPAALQGVRDAIERASGGWASAGGSGADAAAGAGSGGHDYEDEEDAGREGGARGSYAGVSVPPPAQQGQGQGERGTAADVHASGAPEDGMMLPPVPSAADLD